MCVCVCVCVPARFICAAHHWCVLDWGLILLLLLEAFSDICNAFICILFWYRWYRICVLHTCYLCIFAFVYFLFVKSVNRAYFKYVCDQVRGYPLTEGDRELEEVQEG